MATPDTDEVRKVIELELSGVDEPVLEYIAAIIAEEEGGPLGPWRDEVVPYLLSAGLEGVDDDDTGNALCDKIEARLKKVFGGIEKKPSKQKAKADGVTVLNAPINLGTAITTEQSSGFGDVWGYGAQKSFHNDVWESRGHAKGRKERKALKALIALAKKYVEPPPEMQMSQLTRMVLPTDTGCTTKDIHVEKITLWTPGGAALLEDAKLKLTYGRRYGLIGKNGIGKTTLLKAMASQELEGFPKHLRCLHVSQECGTSEQSIVEAVLGADVELQMLLSSQKDVTARLEGAEADSDESREANAALSDICARLEEIDAATADSRARQLLNGLQFTSEMQAAPLSSMSGGWRVRAAIAAALFIKPEVLMLDEPTNHLDLEAVLWLQNHLQTYPHTVLIVSHDRTFLNEVATDIMHVENKQLKPFKGDYDTFEKTRKELLKNQIKEYERFVAERAHMQQFVDTFRYNAKRASLVQSRIKAIEKLEAEAPPEPVDAVPFTFSIPSADAPGSSLVVFQQVGFSYPSRNGGAEKFIFSGVDFNVSAGEKIGIVGPNGAGKSTMLNLMLGDLDPTSGSMSKKPGVLVASFTQHHVDKINLGLSAVENLQVSFPGTLDAAARSWIGNYGLQGDMQTKPCGQMSGGQKSRVAFAMLAFTKPNLIVMDEPTNHLDLETIDALIEALRTFTGGVVVVSHDQHFIEKVCTQLWVVGEGKVGRFSGGFFAEYKKRVLKRLEK